jgi:hypothetical protein
LEDDRTRTRRGAACCADSALPPAVVPRCAGGAACEAATRSREDEKLGQGTARHLHTDRNANRQVQLREYRPAWLPYVYYIAFLFLFGRSTN